MTLHSLRPTFHPTLTPHTMTHTHLTIRHLLRPHHLLVLLACTCLSLAAHGQTASFHTFFADSTLRIDYTLSGDVHAQHIAVDELCMLPHWAGRRTHLDTLALQGNGRIAMHDKRTGRLIYCHSFSTLFQGWLGTEEATRLPKAFEHVMLLPMPRDTAVVTLTLDALTGKPLATLTHTVCPTDILLRHLPSTPPPHRVVHAASHPQPIDVAIVAEGYTEAEADTFYTHAIAACQALFASAPYKRYADRFQVVAVALPSPQSGVSIPGQGLWKHTPLASHFDTFYSARYLTTLRLRTLHNALAGIPYEHIIILANTPHYGGGGIYNSYTLTTARHRSFRPVVVHEFGHSFAGLADEYYYDDMYEPYYIPGREPWEQNITTLTHFSTKWADMLPAATPIPTPAAEAAAHPLGVYEGAGYTSKGVYRPCPDCRMKTNEAPDFCPVCCRATERLIRYYTGE